MNYRYGNLNEFLQNKSESKTGDTIESARTNYIWFVFCFVVAGFNHSNYIYVGLTHTPPLINRYRSVCDWAHSNPAWMSWNVTVVRYNCKTSCGASEGVGNCDFMTGDCICKWGSGNDDVKILDKLIGEF